VQRTTIHSLYWEQVESRSGKTVCLAEQPTALLGRRVDTTEPDKIARGSQPIFSPLAEGSMVGRYVIVGQLGAGGMGVVYAAYDPDLERRVALKLVHSGVDEMRSDARMLREAQALAALSHPNVVSLHDVGTHDGRLYMAMELVDGDTLAAWLKQSTRAWREIVKMFIAAGRGLVAAHAAGIVHRDFKPANVLVGPDGRARVMDFGLARSSEQSDDTRTAIRPLDVRLTMTGSVLGTPPYMPPEAHGAEVGMASDQFSFCVALYEALYAQLPFDHTLAFDDRARWILREPPRRRVPRWLHDLVIRGLAMDPADRHASMRALVDALEHDRRPRRRIVVAAVALVATSAAAFTIHEVRQKRLEAGCAREASAIRSTWNAERARSLGAVLSASKLPFARDLWTRTKPTFDRFADDWASTRIGVCLRSERDRTLSRADADASRACLDEQREALAALTDLLMKSEAITTTVVLPPLSACSDPVRLRHQLDSPIELRPRIRELRARLARAAVAGQAGHHERLLSEARSIATDADKLPWPPLAIAARLEIGDALHQLGRSEEARKELELAFYAAGAAGRDELALEACAKLVHVVGVSLARHDDGLHWARLGEMLVERQASRDEPRIAMLWGSLAMLHDARGEYAQATEKLQSALAIGERSLGRDHPNLVPTLHNLAILFARQGKLPQAIDAIKRSLALAEASFGAEHPALADGLLLLGAFHAESGDLDRGAAQIERAIAIYERAYGREYASLIPALSNLSALRAVRGDYTGALALRERALAITEKQVGPDHPNVAHVLEGLGQIYRALDRGDDAVAAQRRALDIRERALGPDHPDVASSLSVLAETLADRGERTTALTMLARALAIYEKALGPKHADVGMTLATMAMVHGDIGDHAQAIALFERALAILEPARGRDHPSLGNVLHHFGRVRLARHEYANAAATLQRAVEIFQCTGASYQVALSQLLLARALWDGSIDRRRAIESATAARDSFRAAGAMAARDLAEATRWLATHGR